MSKLKINIDVQKVNGWWFTFEQGDKKCDILPAKIYDSITDLLTAVRLLYKSYSETVETEVSFFDGPGEYVLILNRVGKVVRGTIYYFADFSHSYNKDTGEIHFEFEDDLFHFTNQLINAYYRLNQEQNCEFDYQEIVELMNQEKTKTGI